MNMLNTALALPMAGMMFLTLLVWIYLFIQRIRYATGHGIDIEAMKTPTDVAGLIPGENASASHNFKNLVELPVIFYAVCLYLTLFGQVDELHVYCAWAFLVFRVLHSLIHCSYNRVMHRFGVYIIAAIALWIMVVRAFLAVI